MVCLDAADLEMFVAGDLDGAVAARVRTHVSACATCRDRLADIEENLTSLPGLRRVLHSNGTVPAPAHDGQMIGHFRIVRELARGAMGVVYLAEQDHPRRRLALKVLRPSLLSEAMLRRFELEANVLADLDHPGIARVHEAGIALAQTGTVSERLPWLAMEHIEGRRLDEHVREHALSPRATLELLARICDAVHHAHLNGVIHRDLKPANILMSESGPKIVDFGAARIVNTDMTTLSDVGRLVGTLPYMSPEQIAGDPARVDARCDIHALGVIAFRILSGSMPIALDDCSMVEAARRLREDEPARLGRFDRGLRGDVEAIVARAMEKDPADRYQSAAELAADIRRFLRSEPVEARSAGALEQLRRFARRHRLLVTEIAVVFVALAVGLGMALWQANAALRARDEAEAHLAEVLRQADYLMNDVVQDMANVLGTEELQYAVAAQVHDFFETLGPRHPEHMAVQRGWWESLRLRSSHEWNRGNRDLALALLQQSHDLVEAALRRFPDDREVRFQHAYSARFLASRLWSDEHRRLEALELLRAAVAAMAALVEIDPVNHEYRHHYAVFLRVLGGSERASGQFEAARAHLGEARAQGAWLSESAPQDRGERTEFVALLLAEGAMLVQQDEPDEAAALYRDALTELQALGAEAPDDPRCLRYAAAVHIRLARLLLNDDAPASIEHARAALDLYQALDAAEPLLAARNRPPMASMHALLARAFDALDRPEDAADHRARAEAIGRSLGRAED